jgi:ArsR family transcriptional regulator, arsenate/arsenite/antimonite-responsive transcriptional repressor
MTTVTITECCSPVATPDFTPEDANNLARVLKALAEPARLQILNLIRTSPTAESCVCDITAALDLSQPTISYHLKKMVEIGLLTKQKRGYWNWYSINDDQLVNLQKIFSTVLT